MQDALIGAKAQRKRQLAATQAAPLLKPNRRTDDLGRCWLARASAPLRGLANTGRVACSGRLSGFDHVGHLRFERLHDVDAIVDLQ